MIRQGQTMFKVPPKLATDIRAYWMEKENHKVNMNVTNMMINCLLDSSVVLMTTLWNRTYQHIFQSKANAEAEAVSTVFTFVDRQLTAQANSSNPTEAALAQLYAHIQSMPESDQKRRLVKQFNKENGHGTPLVRKQVQSRGLGDSIKKHIFTKGLKRQKNQDKNASMDDLLKVCKLQS